MNIKGSNKLLDTFKYLKDFSSWKINTQSYSETRCGICNNGLPSSVAREKNLRSSGLTDKVLLGEHLSNLWRRNLNRLLLANITIKSVKDKFNQLSSDIKNNIHVLMIFKTKSDDLFPILRDIVLIALIEMYTEVIFYCMCEMIFHLNLFQCKTPFQ